MSTAPTSIAELRKSSQLPATQAGMGTVKKFFESQRGTLSAVLPKHVSPDRMLKLALGALRTTPKLAQCTVESLFGAIVTCSQLGLEPNTPLGHVYLIPFEKREKRGEQWATVRTDVQMIIGYRGMLDLARRSGQIVSIAAHDVCEHDEFRFSYGLSEELIHRPAMTHRGEIVAFYAVAKLVGGGFAFEVMSREAVDAIRDKAAEKNRAKKGPDGRPIITGPWAEYYAEMGRKTVLRRLFKYLPISIELASAAALDERAITAPADLDDTIISAEYARDDEPDHAPDEIHKKGSSPVSGSAPESDPYNDWRLAFDDCGTVEACTDLLAKCKYSPSSDDFKAIRAICEARQQAIVEAQA